MRERARRELEKLKKDGTPAARPDVYYECEKCNRFTKDGKKDPNDPNRGNNVDHIEPVVEIGKARQDYTLSEYIARLDCDVDNLQLLCAPCHDEKTKQERELRKSLKKGK